MNSNNFILEIPQDMSNDFKEWLKDKIKANISEQKQLQGFCIKQDGEKIEVTAESVKESLLPFVSDIVKQLMAQE